MKATVKYGKDLLSLSQAHNVEADITWGHAVTPDDWPVAQLAEHDPATGDVKLELTEYGKRFFTSIANPRKGVWTIDAVTMETIRELPTGCTIDFGDVTWRVYRRDYKRNRVHVREVVA